VKLYPNPTTSVLNIESAGTIQSIAIYNVLGQEVLNRTIDSTSARIDVASFNTGIYVVKSVIDGVTSSSKFIKE
jgi:endoglucanase